MVGLHVYGSANRGDLFPAHLVLDESRFPAHLVLDESRLSEADEAWVPVMTPDGPGVLVRENSD